MKKILLFLFSCFVFHSYSQTLFGVRGGLNHSGITNTLLDKKNGAYFGVLVDIPIKNRYSMQPEIYYSSQGGKSNSIEFSNLNIDYIAISFVNKFYFTDKKNIHFTIGPGLDYFVSKQINIRNGIGENVSITPFDAVIFAGLGCEFGFGLTLEARYKQGVISTDFFGSSDVYELGGSQFNQVFQVGIAYKFKP
jgi:hypothetical protein